MNIEGEEGIFLTLNDCIALFPGLKRNESVLSNDERTILVKLEKILYRNLSIQDVEKLLEQSGASDA